MEDELIVKVEKARQTIFSTMNNVMKMGVPAVAIELILKEVLLDMSTAQVAEMASIIDRMKKEGEVKDGKH